MKEVRWTEPATDNKGELEVIVRRDKEGKLIAVTEYAGEGRGYLQEPTEEMVKRAELEGV